MNEACGITEDITETVKAKRYRTRWLSCQMQAERFRQLWIEEMRQEQLKYDIAQCGVLPTEKEITKE